MHKGLTPLRRTYISQEEPGLIKATAAEEEGPYKPLPNEWRNGYPNLADTFMFNYPRLMAASYANNIPLGTLKAGKEKRVAIIGTGVAGTQAARELVRAGYSVDMYEYTNRIGGRTCTTRIPANTGDTPTASMTTYEMGAMRIPFFNQTAPKPGPGPHAGGPFSSPPECRTSMSEFYANQYKIATAPFPDPGKADLKTDGGVVPGVLSGIYINSGSGVDLTSLFGPEAKPFINTPFTYSWPPDAPGIPNWPDAESARFIKFYNRGVPMNVPYPSTTLDHAIPDNTKPLQLSDAEFESYRQGVLALRTVSFKWKTFSNAVMFTIVGDRSAYINPFGDNSGMQDPFWRSYFDNNRYCGDNCDINMPGHDQCRLWDKFWRNQVMPRYQNVSFFEVATAPPMLPTLRGGKWVANPEWAKGNFGGLGMNGSEAQLFYTIGAGDGSWGAFFPNSALWALRALLFGFAQEHQLIIGCLDERLDNVDMNPVGDGSLVPDVTPEMTPQPSIRGTFKDSAGNAFLMPQFTGVNAFSECHFFKPLSIVTKEDGSEYRDTLWKRVQSGDGKVRLFTSAEVVGMNSTDDGIEVITKETPNPIMYNYVLATAPLWNINQMELKGFDPKDVPDSVTLALDISHWIRSAKVFVALKEPFWKQGSTDKRDKMLFPQVMSTNSILRDVYGLAAPTGSDPFPIVNGGALISYTWEDDAQKFISFEADDLAKMLVQRMEQLFEAFPEKDEQGRPRPKFSDFMLDPTLKSPGSYKVWQWSKQPSYHGCAKAYQSGIENLNFALLTHNKRAWTQGERRNRLYFAGDAYSLESGWMEPAQRMSVDAVLNLLNQDPDTDLNSPGGFKFDKDYVTCFAMSNEASQKTTQLGLPIGGVSAKKADEVASEGGCCSQ